MNGVAKQGARRMDINVTAKSIKELCGSVSYKRGDSFYKAGKVVFHTYTDDLCEAIVRVAEDFSVTIEKQPSAGFSATCSCPTLENYDKSCQHVAAVLIAIYEGKKHQIEQSEQQLDPTDDMATDFMSLFSQQKPRKSGHQLHFEQREVLEVGFILKPMVMADNEYFWGIELKVEQMNVLDIRAFLQGIQQSERSKVGHNFTYNPKQHCFEQAVDRVLHQLFNVVRDESLYIEGTPALMPASTLLIPPSLWQALQHLLQQAPVVTISQDDRNYFGLDVIEGVPPLQFSLQETSSGFELCIDGFDKLLVLPMYQCALSEGKVFRLTEEDCTRLVELKGMLAGPSQNKVVIAKERLDFFLKKVVPGLKKIGHVSLSPKLSQQLQKTPLVAKLYLDRLRNRLLAGLEFQYDQFVIQPLEARDIPEGPMLLRDHQKENEILDLMDECGFSKTDGGYFMQNDDLEYAFLYHVLPKLQGLTQVYATTAVRMRLAKPSTFPKITVKVQKERTNWLEFKFEMDGVRDADIREILDALEVKQKYYRLPNGSLLSLETKEMEEIQRFLLAGPVQDDQYEATFNMPITESLKFLDLLNESEVFEPEQSFKQFSEQLLKPETLNFEVPTQLKSVLRDYQVQGYKWMKLLASYGFGGVLADDMGLGKTLQSITFILSELEQIRTRKQPVLIVCPSSLTYNWLHEFMTFAPEIQALVMDGSAVERKTMLQELGNVDVVITSYPLLRRDLGYYEKQTFHTVFFDEAQAFKNPMTQTARSVKKINADNHFALTGTPMENSLAELWSIYRVIFPQLFNSLEEFSNMQRKDIARRVRPFLLRRMKEDVLEELPGKQEMIESSELLPEQKQLYAAYLAKLRHDTLKHLDKKTFGKSRIRILAGITRLRQICCHPVLFVDGYKGSSAKFEQLLQILEESRHAGRRVLIFSQFTKMLQLIANELSLRGQTYFYLDGQTPSEERVELCNRYNQGERDLFLISLKAGGTGLNLTGADTVVLYDLWWNPAVEEQAADRAHRMGQKNVVQVIKLVARGTIEEKMNELQDKKRDLIADILQPKENASSSLSEQDIRDILML